jgi:hypothetical protein
VATNAATMMCLALVEVLAMTATNPILRDIPHVTPIACPACATGNAHLVRRGPDALARDGKSEIWLFKCDNCSREYLQTVEN